MARVARVWTQPFALALKGALRWGQGSELARLEHVLIAAQSDTGAVGAAEAPVRPTIYGETAASIAAITAHLEPALVGLDCGDPGAWQHALGRAPNNHCAKGALDIALRELRAKTRGRTLFEAERGTRNRVAVSFILGMDAPEVMVAEAARVYAQGVRVFKVKVGRDAARDAQVLGALEHTFAGAGVTLYADANEGFAPETAARELARLARLGVAYVEEPLPVHLLRARAALRAAEVLPIVADDSCFTLPELARELDFDTFDILNIKPARSGFTVSEQMLALAQEAGKGVMVGSQASSGLGTLHAAIFSSRAGVTHPCELSFVLKLEQDILSGPFSFEGGYLDTESLRGLSLAPAFAPAVPRG